MENGSELFGMLTIRSLKLGIKTYIERVVPYKYIFCLLFLNFFTHYLFIFQYSFVGDDWTDIVYFASRNMSLTHLMLESQRPLSYVIFKVAVETFGSYAFAYQILNLITTSLIILLVFLISKTILAKVFEDSTIYAFLVAIFFCVIFNIDQLYSWGVISINNFSIIFYLSTFYFYINAERKQYYLFLSIFSFLIAVFSYELGIFFPIICFFYDIIFNQNWKKSLWYIIPLGIYGIIRETHWFGFGWVYTDRDYSNLSQFLQEFCQNILNIFKYEISLTKANIFHGASGLFNLNHIVFVALIFSDCICIFLIFKYLLIPGFSKSCKYYNFQNAVKLLCIGILGVLLSNTIISFSGGVESRHLIFIDFFIFLSIVAFVGPLLTKKLAVISLFCIILISLLISQGLAVNWIIAGDICNSVNQSISENSKNISQYNYVFVNSDELLNSISNSELKYNLDNLQLYNGWLYMYLNSDCLPYWSVGSMLYGGGVANTSRIHLIYGNMIDYNQANVILTSYNGSITYEDMTTETYHSINRTEYFEFNSTNLLSHFYTKEHLEFLFLQ